MASKQSTFVVVSNAVLLAVCRSFLAALGLNLQKLSMNRETEKPLSQRRPIIKQPLWIIGLSLITTGSLLDFVAFGMAPQVSAHETRKTAV